VVDEIPELVGVEGVEDVLGSGLVESFPAGSAADEVDAEFLGGFEVPDTISNVDGVFQAAIGLLDCGGDDVGAVIVLGGGDHGDVFHRDSGGFEFEGNGFPPVSGGNGERDFALANFVNEFNGSFRRRKATGVGLIEDLQARQKALPGFGFDFDPFFVLGIWECLVHNGFGSDFFQVGKELGG